MQHIYCRRLEDGLHHQHQRTSQGERRPFALAAAKPHYAPDRPCDIVHIALTLQLDIAQKTLSGTCATSVRAVRGGASRLSLDAVDLQITRAACQGEPFRLHL